MFSLTIFISVLIIACPCALGLATPTDGIDEKYLLQLAATMETDGELSVLPKADKQPLTPYHMKIETVNTGLTKDVIIDGNVMEENLASVGLDKEWLKSQLNRQNIKDASEVFYAALDNTKKLHISKRVLIIVNSKVNTVLSNK